MRSFIQPLAVLLLLGIVTCWYGFIQPPLRVADGKGWDGVSYHKMYQHYKGLPTDGEFNPPFNKRIGLPWLAASLEIDAAKAFRLINLASGVLAVIFTYLSLRSRCSGVILFACLAPMLFYVFSPIRFPNFYPFMVDPPAMMLYALTTYLLTKELLISAVVTLALSSLFRESGVYFGTGLAMVMLWHGPGKRWKAWFALAVALAAALTVARLQLPGPPYFQWIVVASAIKNKLLDPAETLRVFACISLTLGPFALFRFFGDKVNREKSRCLLLDFGAVSLLLSLAMAAVGGTDMSRIFFIGYPLFVLVLADWLRHQDLLKVGIAAFAGMVANRFHRIIPEPTAIFPSHDLSGYFSFTPDHSYISTSITTLAYFVFLWFILFGPAWGHLEILFRQIKAWALSVRL